MNPFKPLFLAAPLALALGTVAIGDDTSKQKEKSSAAAQHQGVSHEMHQAMQDGSQKMNAMTMTGNADQDFATMMKMHHEHGLKMAESYLKGAKDPKIRQMAEKIVAAQKKEIREFEQWLSSQGKSPASTQ